MGVLEIDPLAVKMLETDLQAVGGALGAGSDLLVMVVAILPVVPSPAYLF